MIRRTTRSLLGSAAAAIDVAATKAAYARSARARKGSRAESLSHEQRMEALEAIAARFREATPGEYFRPPRDAIAPTSRRRRLLPDGGEVRDLRWNSDYTTLLPEVAKRYARGVENQRAAARLWLHPHHAGRRRPVVVLVHGYLAGRHSVEEGVWPSAWLYQELGLDLAFFVLPFHGVRAWRGRLGAPPFPSSDPRVTNEGFRQAMGDLGDLVSWLLGQGHPEVGAMGMSLGGYTTSLAATVLERLSFAVPVIPLTSLADFARDQGRLGENAEQAELEHAALDAVHAWVSPLHREPCIDAARMMILAAEADRITPIRHAERLADHFAVPLHSWHGGHLLQLGRADGFREVGRFLNRIGVVDDRRKRS